MVMKPAQCRAGRALLGWSQDELSARSKVAKATIANFEAENCLPYERTLQDLVTAMEAAGVQFIQENGGGVGVRLKNAVASIERIVNMDSFDGIKVRVSFRGRSIQVVMGVEVLEDLDRVPAYRTSEEVRSSFETHRDKIFWPWKDTPMPALLNQSKLRLKMSKVDSCHGEESGTPPTPPARCPAVRR